MTVKEKIEEVLNQNDGICLDSEEDKKILLERIITKLEENHTERKNT